MNRPRRPRTAPIRGFTLVELLVTIAIIVGLIAILVPVVGGVRKSARSADTLNWLNQLSAAIDRYQQDFRAYPGPLGYRQIRTVDIAAGGGAPLPGPGFARFDISVAPGTPAGAFDLPSAPGTNVAPLITSSENLVLGLIGGLVVRVPAGSSNPELHYDPSLIGAGPTSLNTVGPRKQFAPYIEARNLSWRDGATGRTGLYQDEITTGQDSVIPEFLDTFPDPMPVLYLRARTGVAPVAQNADTPTRNTVITNSVGLSPTSADFHYGPYDLLQLSGYINVGTASVTPIGVGRKFINHGLREVSVGSTTLGDEPYVNAYPYFRNPQLTGAGTLSSAVARGADRYILISAGPDRTYGTKDDITSFGKVGE